MSDTEIRETIALVESLREIAGEREWDRKAEEVAGKGRLLQVAAEIAERLARLERRLESAYAEPEKRAAGEETARLVALGRVTAEVGLKINDLLAILATRLDLYEICLKSGEEERARSNLQLVREYLQKVETFAVRLLDFSGQPSRPLPTHLNRIVESTVSFARLLRAYENIEFDADLAVDLPSLTIDPARWQQLLLSLLANAADAVGRRKGEGGRIRIVTRKESGPDRVVLVVQDEGRGIAPHDLPHLFEPGYTTKGAQREGLGLTTCKRIVEESGGRISIDGAPGRGATVTISIPLAR